MQLQLVECILLVKEQHYSEGGREGGRERRGEEREREGGRERGREGGSSSTVRV